ncbi:MAG: hypothetical protein AAF653_07270 [Chloroflexota bacterium]
MESGTLSDFFQQLQGQGQIVGIFILFGVMFFMTFGLYFILQARKIMRKNNPDSQQPRPDAISQLMDWINNLSSNNATSGSTSGQSITADTAMPDLDMLLATSAPAPAVSPQPARAAAPVEPVAPRQHGIVTITMADGRMVEAAEMLVIARDRTTDNLVVQIGELAYDGTENSVDATYQRKFKKLMRELADIAPVLSNGNTTAPESPSFADLITAPPPPKPKPEAPTKSTVTMPAAEPDEPLDLAGQIDLFLQQKLQADPELAARGLRVQGAPDGTVQIQVDGEVYAGVGEVTDTEVRAYLQQVIAEWQSRQ